MKANYSWHVSSKTHTLGRERLPRVTELRGGIPVSQSGNVVEERKANLEVDSAGLIHQREP